MISSSNEDDTSRLIESIEIVQKLVEGLTVVVGIARLALATDCIELVDEDDSRSLSAGSSEELTNALRTNTDVDLIEFGSRHIEERNTSFTGNSTCEQCLTSTRGTNEQNTLRQSATQLVVALRMLQKVDDIKKLFLGLITAVYVAESSVLVLRTNFGAGATANLLENAAGLDEEGDQNQGDVSCQREASEPPDPLENDVPHGLLNDNVDWVALDTNTAACLANLSSTHVGAHSLADSLDLLRRQTVVASLCVSDCDRLSSLLERLSVQTVGDGVCGELASVVAIDDDLRHVGAHDSRVERSLRSSTVGVVIGSFLKTGKLVPGRAAEQRALLHETETEHANPGLLANVCERTVARQGRV